MPIQTLIHHYGYLGVFLILFIEMVGLLFPAETTLILAGVEWTKGVFNLIPLLLLASIANVLGSTLAYGIGRFFGRPLLSRCGKYIGLTDKRLDNVTTLFANYQILIIVFGKFKAGIRVLIPYLAGINNLSFVVFSFYNAISALLWATTFIIIGRSIGIWWSRYHQVFYHYTVPGMLFVGFLIGVYIGIRIYKKRQA